MKIGLVMEGGAMRGMFTAGVTDVLMENDIQFEGAIGVSAGATFGCNVKSKQIGRAFRYNKRFCNDWRYCSLRSWILTGDLYGAKFCYETLPFELDIYDQETYAANPMDFYVVATDNATGRAVYHNCLKGDEQDLLWIRASASMPVASRPVEIGGRKFSDGGTSNSVPLDFMKHKGYQKNVVILTQPDSYRKEQMKHFGLIRSMLWKYPALIRALETRPDRYNKNIAFIKQEEAAGNAFVIRPDEALNIGSVEHDPKELTRVYEIGRRIAERDLPALKAFIEKCRLTED